MKKPTKLIFGGAFDPFHKGHLTILTTLYKQLAGQVSGIHLIPTGHPPHKPEPYASILQRVAMLKTVCETELATLTPLWHYDIDLYECQKKTPSYTLDTVLYLKEKFPDTRFTLIIGDDQYFRFHTWHSPDALLDHVQLLVINRHQTKDYQTYWHAHFPRFNFKETITVCHITPVPISSQEIREKLKAGSPIDQDVPPSIATYIHKATPYPL